MTLPKVTVPVVRSYAREAIGDWLIVAGAVGLFISLFLTWSHQGPGPAQAVSVALPPGVPANPTAWQVYSVTEVFLALVSAVLLLTALVGGRRARLGCLLAAGIGLAFTLRALGAPPTSDANVLNPVAGIPQYLPSSATAGVGETVAIAALGAALGGLALSLTAD